MRGKHSSPITRLMLTSLFVIANVPTEAANQQTGSPSAQKQVKSTGNSAVKTAAKSTAKTAASSAPGSNGKLAEQLLSKANLLVSQQQYDLAISTYVDSYLANWHNEKHGDVCAAQLIVLASKLDAVRSLHAYRMALFCDPQSRSASIGHARMMYGGSDNPIELEKRGDGCVRKGDKFGALVEYSNSLEKANNAEVRKKFQKVLSECGFKTWPLSWSEGTSVDYGQTMQVLQSWVRSAWDMDDNDSTKNYRVVALWEIGRNGELSHLRIEKSSGNKKLDEVALNAVRRAAPFRKLPKNAEKSVEIGFTFDYNSLSKNIRTESDAVRQAMMDKAKAAVTAGNFAEACEILKKAEESATRRQMALVQGKLVDALLLQASLPTVSATDALELIREAFRREPDNPEVLTRLEEGIRATGKDPNSFEVRVTMGDEYLAARKFESAVAEYKAAAALQNDPQIQAKLATAESKVKAANTLLRWKAFAFQNPKSIEAQLSIGLSCKDLGDKEQAIAAYKKVLELDPQNVSAKKAIAELSP